MNVLQAIDHLSRERELRFLVIGGHAVNVHGYSRTTYDLDLLVEKRLRADWTQALNELGYRLSREHEVFMQFNPPEPQAWPVDFMLVSPETFSGMWAEAVTTTLDAVPVRTPSLRHLLALKLHVIKQSLPHRVVKDMDDVLRLIEANAVDVRGDSFKQLCLKYASLELHEKLVRHCG